MDIPIKNTLPDRGVASQTGQEPDIPDCTKNIPQNATETPCIVPAHTYRNKKVEFNELINIFSSLASDILNRSPLASQLLHGFICKTQQMISDLSSVKLDDRLLGLMTSTTDSIMQSLTGSWTKDLAEPLVDLMERVLRMIYHFSTPHTDPQQMVHNLSRQQDDHQFLADHNTSDSRPPPNHGNQCLI